MVGWLGMVGGITLNLCDPNEIVDKNNHKYSNSGVSFVGPLHRFNKKLQATAHHMYAGSRRLTGLHAFQLFWDSQSSSHTGISSLIQAKRVV